MARMTYEQAEAKNLTGDTVFDPYDLRHGEIIGWGNDFLEIAIKWTDKTYSTISYTYLTSVAPHSWRVVA